MTKYAKHPRNVRKMADGGSVGFFERLAAGNIDDPKSEAYRRWGAGSKSAEPAAEPAKSEPEIPDASPRTSVGSMDGLPTSDASESEREVSRNRERAADIVKPTTRPAKPRPIVKPVAQTKSAGPTPEQKAPAPSPAAPTKPRTQTERDARQSAEMDDTPLVKGAKAVGGFFSGVAKAVGDTVRGAASSQITNKPSQGAPSIYAGPDEWARYRRAQSEGKSNYADGGVIGSGCKDRNYGKK